MDKDILNSIITISSILVAFIIPLIIYLINNYSSKKERLIEKMRLYYPKLNSFKELIYSVHNIDFWIPKEEIYAISKALRSGNKEIIKQHSKTSDLFSAYYAYWSIANKFGTETISETSTDYNYRYTFREINDFKIWTNCIWYSIFNRNDIKDKIDNDSFTPLDDFCRNKIESLISKIGSNYTQQKLSISLISQIAGDVEVDVLIPLYYLTLKYEQPIDSIVIKLFIFLTLSLFVGVILPLILLLLNPVSIMCIAIPCIIGILVIAFIVIICLMWGYMKTIEKE